MPGANERPMIAQQVLSVVRHAGLKSIQGEAMKTAIGAVTVAVATLASGSAFAAACNQTLKIAHEDWPPYNFVEGDNVTGINVDIVKMVAEEIGCDVKFSQMPWKRGLQGLKDGSVHMMMTANITDEREKFAKFSSPYLDYQSVLWKNAGDETSYDSLETFLKDGKQVGIVREYTYGKDADRILDANQSQVTVSNGTIDNVRLVAAGRIDGTIGNRYTVGYMARQNGIRDKITASGVVVQNTPVHFMFSKESVSDETVNAWSQAVKQLRGTGKFKAVVEKYAGAES